MSIAESPGHIVTLRSTVHGAVMENVFQYYSVGGTQLLPQVAADYFEDVIVDLWESLLTVAAQIISVKVETTHPEGYVAYPTYVRALYGQGTVEVETLPVYVALRLIKNPDVENQDLPAPDSPWRLGSTRIGGIPESMSLAGGFFNPTYETAAQNLCNALLSYADSGETYAMYMRRFVPGDEVPDFFVPVLGMEPGSLLTSQNSRKLNY